MASPDSIEIKGNTYKKLGNIKGAGWTTGSGAPTTNGVIEGDLYLDKDTGKVYLWSNSSWTENGNIKGKDGATGTGWASGRSEPSFNVGRANEFYLNTSNGDVYKSNDNGAYVKVGNITGPQGPAGGIGPEGPRGPQGATGEKGTGWTSGRSEPSFNVGRANEFYLNTSNGDVYKSNDNGAYVKVGNITGPQGPKGDRGQQGPAGGIGPQGPQGPRGPQGPMGDRGPQGPSGSAVGTGTLDLSSSSNGIKFNTSSYYVTNMEAGTVSVNINAAVGNEAYTTVSFHGGTKGSGKWHIVVIALGIHCNSVSIGTDKISNTGFAIWVRNVYSASKRSLTLYYIAVKYY